MRVSRSTVWRRPRRGPRPEDGVQLGATAVATRKPASERKPRRKVAAAAPGLSPGRTPKNRSAPKRLAAAASADSSSPEDVEHDGGSGLAQAPSRGRPAREPGGDATNTRRPSIGAVRGAGLVLATLATEPSASVPSRRHRRARARVVSGPKMPSLPMPALRWNSVSAPSVSGPKMPSSLPASNPSMLSRRWSSTTSSPRSIGRRTYSSRSPRRKPLSTRRPRLAATDSVDRNARRSWNHRSSRSVVEPNVPARHARLVPERDEPMLEVADGLAAAAGPEDGRIAQPMNSARSWRSAPLPLAPTMRLAGSPSLNTSSVGMLITS